MIPPALPHATLVALRATALSARAFTTVVGKHRRDTAQVLRVAGAFGVGASARADALRFGWWANEVMDIGGDHGALVVDLSAVAGELPEALVLRPARLIGGGHGKLVVVGGRPAAAPHLTVADSVAEGVRALVGALPTRPERALEWPPTGLTIRTGAWSCPEDGAVAAWVSVEGVYPPGSAGFDDALWIRWSIDALVELLDPVALVVDLRRFQYIWGDDLRLEPWDRRPGCVIAPSSSREALAIAVDPEDFVDDEAAAIAWVARARRR